MTLSFVNGSPVAMSEIPTFDFHAFESEVCSLGDRRILAHWRLPDARIVCVLGNPKTHKMEIIATPSDTYRNITDKVPALHRFERELMNATDSHPITPLKGTAAHEVAVGPVHAGVIEPGHFRFQCMGEDVHYLEIRLGYQHRGVERLIVDAKNDIRRLSLAETIAGDTSVAASYAASCALGLAPLGSYSRNLVTLLVELERIANHTGDLGALSGDVAYLPTSSFCGRIRGEYLNMTAELCGNRFGRNSLYAVGPSKDTLDKLCEWFSRTRRELFHALDLMFSEAGVIERFEGTGRVDASIAKMIGLTGMAGRASGLSVDSRIDFPMDGETVTESLVGNEPMTGDVFSRARQRYVELCVSHAIVERLLELDPSELAVPGPNVVYSATSAMPDSVTVSAVEAWRGELVHIAVRRGMDVVQYKVFDPSYHNWFGLAQALRDEQISNFPICNKSFNLSYCGVDR